MASKGQPVTQALLARAHSPDSANRIYTEKIQHRPLFLRPTSPPPQVTMREARRKERQRKVKDRKKAMKPKPLSARERRRLALYAVPREGQRHETYLPLHNLWLGYIREILGNEVYTGGTNTAAKLSSADLHGAEVKVVRSGCVGRVGIKGIVIKDARFVLKVITSNNKIKTVPKEGTIFQVTIPPGPPKEKGNGQNTTVDGDKPTKSLVVEIHGDQFTYRSADRANKKFKSHFIKKI